MYILKYKHQDKPTHILDSLPNRENKIRLICCCKRVKGIANKKYTTMFNKESNVHSKIAYPFSAL